MCQPSASQLHTIVESVDHCDMHLILMRVRKKAKCAVMTGVDQDAAAHALLVMIRDAASAYLASERAMEILTPRERQLAALLAEGASNARLAEKLGCTERTVRAHIENMQRKTGASNRLSLLAVVSGIGFSANMQDSIIQ